jgi:hypothetical protein
MVPEWTQLFRETHFFFNESQERQEAMKRKRTVGNRDTLRALAPRTL